MITYFCTYFCILSLVPQQVWDFYLYWGDPALHHFVVLAFVIGNAEAILKVTLVELNFQRVTVCLLLRRTVLHPSATRGGYTGRSPLGSYHCCTWLFSR